MVIGGYLLRETRIPLNLSDAFEWVPERSWQTAREFFDGGCLRRKSVQAAKAIARCNAVRSKAFHLPEARDVIARPETPEKNQTERP